jgi:glycosyltransferase involved in cell wall biosynthesis
MLTRHGTEEQFDVYDPILPELTAGGMLKRLQRAIDVRSFDVHGVAACITDTRRVIEVVRRFDLIWVLNARTPNILRIWKWPNAHLDLDDVPSTYERARAASAASLASRLKARIQQKLLHRRELLWKDRFTTLSVCSEADRQYLHGGSEMHVIPNGFERPETEPVRNRSTAPPYLGFIGLYDYAPNREGVEWFLDKCWPLIRAAIPDVKFRLVGSGTEVIQRRELAGVHGLGWVEDPAPEIATWSAMVIPIQVGGGTRVKIADAFSRKCPVVSTSLGAFGYNVQDGNQLRLADGPTAFANTCIELIRKPETGVATAERAWTEFLKKWTWEAITPKILAAAEDCLRRRRSNRVLVGT